MKEDRQMERYDEPGGELTRHLGGAARAAAMGVVTARRVRAERDAKLHRQRVRQLSPELRRASRSMSGAATPARRAGPMPREGAATTAQRRESTQPQSRATTTAQRRESTQQSRSRQPRTARRGPVIETTGRAVEWAERGAKKSTEGQWRYANNLARRQGVKLDRDEWRDMTFRTASHRIDALHGAKLNPKYQRYMGHER